MPAKLHFISAGAGSGKTFRLTQILHAKLTGGAAKPAGVIATTFTRKAAAELRERVRTDLVARGDFALANAMGQARIGTINSVCGDLLKRFAFEAGMPTEQQVLEEAQANALVTEAIDVVLEPGVVRELMDIVRRLGLEDSWKGDLEKLVNKARSNDIGPQALAGFGAVNADDLLKHFPAPVKSNLDAKLAKEIDAAIPIMDAMAGGGLPKNATEYIDLVKTFRGDLGANRVRWSDWAKVSKKETGAKLREIAADIVATTARHPEHPRLHADLRRYLELMFEAASKTLDVYSSRKRDMGVVDFVDQEHLLLRTLDDADVAATMRDELDLLLVDEFQDTSPIQLALFLKLSAFARETYWVGDVKQAIYGFRDSDTALTEAVLAALPELNGDKEILAASWRSRPSLVRLVNNVFVNAFAGILEPEEVKLQPKRKEIDTGPAFANWSLVGNNKNDEAAALAAGLQELMASGYKVFDKEAEELRPARYSDVAILARYNENVVELAAALAGAGIPTATEQPGLLLRPEIALALACLRRLSDPADTIATAEILSLADCANPETWLADRLRYLGAGNRPDGWKEAEADGHPLITRIARLREALPVLSPREAVQLVVTQCGLARRVLQWAPNEAEARIHLANLDELVRLAAAYEDERRNTRASATISGFLLWLAARGESGKDSLATPAIDAVQVLTHHGAKGLEWPIVVLRDLQAAHRTNLWSISTQSRKKLDVAAPLMGRFVRYWPWPYGKQSKVDIATEIDATAIGKKFATAAIEEGKRLLYVSMTRARDLLVFARSERHPTGPWIDSLDAGWLLPDTPAETLALPSGAAVPYAHRAFTAGEVAPPGNVKQTLRYFIEPAEISEHFPLAFRPSGAQPVACAVGEPVRIGERIPLANGADMNAVGLALHACIAASLVDPATPLSVDEVRGVIEGFGLSAIVEPEPVRQQIGALGRWIEGKWPGARARVECPVESLLEGGQTLRGQIDLLLETAEGWVIIDHKASPSAAANWGEIAKGYAGQLFAYAKAVERATQRTSAQNWIYFPVAGGAIPVSFIP